MARVISRRALIAGAAAIPAAMARETCAARQDEPAIPHTRAGLQLQWVLDQLNTGAANLAVADVTPRFTDLYLSALSAQDIIDSLAIYAPLIAPATIARFEGGVTHQHANVLIDTPTGYWRIKLALEFNDPYRIDEFYFEQIAIPEAPDRPRSWNGLVPYFESIAPNSAFIAGEIVDGQLSTIAEYRSSDSFPIASSFKLFVLGALASQIATGQLSWADQVTISNELRSLPSGNLYYEPAGSIFPLEYVAERMIAESDNTATDHCIHAAGRERIEAALPSLGHAHPEEMTPLMYTREWFAMRIHFDEDAVQEYVSASVDERRAILAETVDPLADTLLETDPWPGPADSDRIEWFASVSDLARTMTDLYRFAQTSRTAVVGNALSLFPGLSLDPSAWSFVGFKEGYETGLKAWSWLLRRNDGRWFVLVGLIHDLEQEIDSAQFHELMLAGAALLAKHEG